MAAATAAAVSSRMDELVHAAKIKLKEKRKEILASSHPWTPWALVELLDIPDCGDVPAELILYKAFVNKRNRGINIEEDSQQCDEGIKTRSQSTGDQLLSGQYVDKVLQYEFKEVTKSGIVFFRDGKEYPVRRKQYLMETKKSRGKITAA